MTTGSYVWDAWFARQGQRTRPLRRAMPRRRIAERLHEKLLAAGYEGVSMPERVNFNPGYRESWRWKAQLGAGVEIGSQLSMGECLKLSDDDLHKWID